MSSLAASKTYALRKRSRVRTKSALKSLFLIFGLFLFFSLPTQAQLPTDTLAEVQMLRSSGQYRDAGNLLKQWHNNNPASVETLWLMAQIEFERKRYSSARKYYSEAIEMEPGNLYLKLDYIDKLLYMSHFQLASNMLFFNLSAEERRNPFALAVMARYYYWTGDVNKAKNFALQARQGGYADIEPLLLEIEFYSSPYIAVNFDYTSDTQPLEKLNPSLEAGYWHSRWLNFKVEANPNWFVTPETKKQINIFSLSNQFRPVHGLEINTMAGFLKFPEHSPEFIGEVDFTLNLPGGFSISSALSKEPYLYTISSLDSPITPLRYIVMYAWDQKNGFMLNTAFHATQFQDENRIKGFWAWFLSPAIKTGPVSWRAGYAFSNSDAEESRFSSVKTSEEIIQNWEPNQIIEGIYRPYFTPHDMQIHALLLQTEIRLSENSTISIRGNYGFLARANNPYLFLDADAAGNLDIQTGNSEINFKPFEFIAEGSFKLSNKLTGVLGYQFKRILFYDMQNAKVGLNYRL